MISIDSNNPGIQLKITPPSGTYTLGGYYKAFQAKDSEILEYIPMGEPFDNWSSIFTIHQSFIKENRTCPNVPNLCVVQLLSWIANIARNSSLTHHEAVAGNDFSVSKAAIQYQYQNGQCELLYAEYYYKNGTLCGVQYTEKLTSWLNSSEAKKETDKISKKIAGLVSVERHTHETKSEKNTPKS